MESLINILRRINYQLEDGKWSFETKGMIIDDDLLDITEVDKDDEPLIAKEKELIATPIQVQ